MRGREGTCKPGANYPFPCFVENSRRLRRLRKALLPKVPAGRRTTENSKGDRYLDGEEPWVPLSGTSCGISRDTFLCGRFENRLQTRLCVFVATPTSLLRWLVCRIFLTEREIYRKMISLVKIISLFRNDTDEWQESGNFWDSLRELQVFFFQRFNRKLSVIFRALNALSRNDNSFKWTVWQEFLILREKIFEIFLRELEFFFLKDLTENYRHLS